jgi:hypothetical protein
VHPLKQVFAGWYPVGHSTPHRALAARSTLHASTH